MQLPLARLGKVVEAHLPAARGVLPLRSNPTLLLETMEGRLERAVVNAENIGGGLLDQFGDSVSVRCTAKQCAQDDHVQGPVQLGSH